MWLWSEQIHEMFTQKSGSDPKCQSTPVFILKPGLF